MTRNKDSAQQFWHRVDVRLRETGLNLYDLADAAAVPYKSILSWRQKHLFPDLETASLIAARMACSIDSLMGMKAADSTDPRINAIIEYLSSDEEKLEAAEILIFGKKAGQSSASDRDMA